MPQSEVGEERQPSPEWALQAFREYLISELKAAANMRDRDLDLEIERMTEDMSPAELRHYRRWLTMLAEP